MIDTLTFNTSVRRAEMVLNMKRIIRGIANLESMLGMVLLLMALETLPVVVHGQSVTEFTVCTLHRPPMVRVCLTKNMELL